MMHNKRRLPQIACLAVFALLAVKCGTTPAAPTATLMPSPPAITPTLASPTTTPSPHKGGQQRGYTFKAKVVTMKGVTKTVQQGYLLFLPQGYETSSDKKWPLLLYLHGVGARGNSLALVRRLGIPRIVEEQPDFPFIVVSPQCPADIWGDDILWSHLAGALDSLLDEVVATYAVDPGRIYLTGYSMGGYGTWFLATQYPGRFAAIAPVSGGGQPDTVCTIKNVPVWAFHGERDHVVSLEEAEAMVDALRACGGDVRLTVYPGADHFVEMRTYENPELYAWFLQHARGP